MKLWINYESTLCQWYGVNTVWKDNQKRYGSKVCQFSNRLQRRLSAMHKRKCRSNFINNLARFGRLHPETRRTNIFFTAIAASSWDFSFGGRHYLWMMPLSGIIVRSAFFLFDFSLCRPSGKMTNPSADIRMFPFVFVLTHDSPWNINYGVLWIYALEAQQQSPISDRKIEK